MREKLLPIISIVEKIVGRKESLPVLSCIVLDIGKEIIVKATNLESGVEARIPGEIKEKGVVAIPATIFSQTLKSIHSDIINLSLEGGNLLIESKGSKTLIKSTPHAEFPNLSVVDIKNGVQVSRYALLSALQSVSYAASPSMIRPELGSVYISLKGKEITCAATDSFRLAEKKIESLNIDEELEFLIPLKHAIELVAILERVPDEKVMLYIDDTQFMVQAESLQYVSRLTDAQFPNYKEIFPKTFSTEITLLKNDMVETLRKARVFSGSEQRVGLHVYPKKKVFDITAQSASIGEMSNSLEGAFSGEDVDINFNVGYLSDCFSVIDSDSITLGFSGPGKPVVIRGVSDTSFTYLAMPLNR